MSVSLAQEYQFARIALEVAVDKLFCYRIAPSLQGMIKPGCWVHISFGRSIKTGCVVVLAETAEVPEVKDILGVDVSRSPVTPKLLNLALWISEYYFCPLGLVLKAMVPATIRNKKAKQKLQWRIYYEELPHLQKILTDKEKHLIQYLIQQGGSVLSSQVIQENVVKLAFLKRLAQKGLIRLESEPLYRDPVADQLIQPRKQIILTEEQQTAIAHIHHKLCEAAFSVSLLFGVTGSGKTEVYLSAVQKALNLGKEAIFLVPEIALTPQTVERVKACFGDKVALVHSRLSHGERF
ncbi:MAG: DEAD/DEAH box helicase family protein, partial [Chlamydiota bacterium]|nr:DEAD/DEAH box helicase family protein [Chlamydiota bacterium]